MDLIYKPEGEVMWKRQWMMGVASGGHQFIRVHENRMQHKIYLENQPSVFQGAFLVIPVHFSSHIYHAGQSKP